MIQTHSEIVGAPYQSHQHFGTTVTVIVGFLQCTCLWWFEIRFPDNLSSQQALRVEFSHFLVWGFYSHWRAVPSTMAQCYAVPVKSTSLYNNLRMELLRTCLKRLARWNCIQFCWVCFVLFFPLQISVTFLDKNITFPQGTATISFNDLVAVCGFEFSVVLVGFFFCFLAFWVGAPCVWSLPRQKGLI